jgi:formamidopyrimidine-DNA glycosylase
MPELPEVETLRRDLEARVIGRTIVSCEVSEDAPRLVQLVTRAEFCRQMTGRRIVGLRRRGKYLIVDLDDAVPTARAWVLHRGMSGNVLYRERGAPADPWVRAVFVLDDGHGGGGGEGGGGHELRWADLRKFGKMWIVEDATMVIETLGPEPMEAEFTPAVLRARAGKRTMPIKSLLLDQKVVAGVGNLYSDEALWYARVHPLRPASRLKPAEWAALHEGIVRALRMGIEARGSSLGTTLRDHVNIDGDPGSNQDTVRAYGRDGEPCYRCGTMMRRLVVGGRSAVFCPACQRAPRGVRGAKKKVGMRRTKGKLLAKRAV